MNEVKEHPISFQGWGIRAILEDRKTETRRVIKMPILENTGMPGDYTPANRPESWGEQDEYWAMMDMGFIETYPTGIKCPYGKPGDRLWARESFYVVDLPGMGDNPCLIYDDEYQKCYDLDDEGEYTTQVKKIPVRPCFQRFGHKPSIYMPRWASRITLEVTDVGVERVQWITAKDVEAEGLDVVGNLPHPISLPKNYPKSKYNKLIEEIAREHIWKPLWDLINAKPKPMMKGGVITHYVSYPWEDIQETREHRGLKWFVKGNPHVWRVQFKRIQEATDDTD